MKKAIFLHTNFADPESIQLLKNAGFEPISVYGESPKHKADLIVKTANDHNLDLKHSWLIGETLDDIEAANRTGCHTILLANGGEKQWHVTPWRQPEFLSPNFEYAAGAVVLKNIYQMIREQFSSN